MYRIDWHQLEKNAQTSPQDFFEKLNYQIAVKLYHSFGIFEYDYNTPGSEFYLTMKKDCDELSAKRGDVIGWQAKFWLNKRDSEHSSLDKEELIKNFSKSLEYKPGLKVWIICTPGQPSNTKPYYVRTSLEGELKKIKPDIKIFFWNKPSYESIFHSSLDQFISIINHYFASQFLSYQVFKDHSGGRLDILRKRYDTDLYTPGNMDKDLISSIFYKKLLSKLEDKIKHNLENRKELLKSYILNDVTNKFLKTSDESEATKEDKNHINKLKNLIDELLVLHGKLHIYEEQEKTLGFTKHLLLIFESHKEKVNKLIESTKVRRKDNNEVYFQYDSDVENVIHLHNCLGVIAGNLIDRTIKIYTLLGLISRQVFNVFGEAGFGKTNFACHITEHLLKNKLPVLLIPGIDIRSTGKSVQEQILNFLGVDKTILFKDFVGIIDSIGFIYGIKIPIILDGLNETQPNSSIWHPTIQYIIQDIEKFENVILITTCRNSYTNQVFDCDEINDVPSSIILEGFQENINEAIDKYFSKYNITPQNDDFDKNIFKNPLLLKIFSVVNEGKTAEINESNIYKAIDSYITEIIERISVTEGKVNPILKKNTLNGITEFAKNLWENNLRGIKYEDGLGLLPFFDPGHKDSNYWNTISHKILEEGLLFRNIHDDVENV